VVVRGKTVSLTEVIRLLTFAQYDGNLSDVSSILASGSFRRYDPKAAPNTRPSNNLYSDHIAA